jgi:flagellar hook-length control protein FliK
MTAHAVGPSSAVPTSSKGAQNTATPGSAAAFEHQLHAARQRDAQVAPGQRDSATGSDGRHDSSPAKAHARRADADTDKGQDKTSGKNDMPSATTAQPPATAKAPAPPAANTAAPPVAEVMAGVVAHGSAAVEQDADGDEQGAAALVGAMLALVGPAADKLLAPGVPASSGKRVAAGAGAAVLLQAGDAAAKAVSASMASTVMPPPLLAANGLSLDPKSLRDSARVDTTPVPGLSAPAATTPAAPVSVPIAAPVGSHAFAQELGQQVSWFVGQDVKQARIRLHPEELGSLDLKISVNHGRVDVVFHAQHPGAVTAVQQSLPQLDQMLAQHGLSLGHAEVGQHDRGDQSGQGGHDERASEIDEVHGPGLVTPLAQLGLVDAFA